MKTSLGLHCCNGDGPLPSVSEPTESAPTQVPPSQPVSGTRLTLPAATETAPASGGLEDVGAQLELVSARLHRLALISPGDSALQPAVKRVRAKVPSVRKSLTGTNADAERLQTALEILARLEAIFPLLDKQAEQFADKPTHLSAVDGVRSAYRQALERLFEQDARASFNSAEQQAKALPRGLINIELDRMEAHAEKNHKLLRPAERLLQWVPDMRRRLDGLEAMDPAATPPATLIAEGEFIQLGLEGMDQFDRQLHAFEFLLKSRPGALDTPTVEAHNRLNSRVEAIRQAYFAGDLANLKTRVVSLREDPAVPRFYAAMPGMLAVTSLIAQIGITYVAAAASGGIGGLFAGGARGAATGLTARGALAFAGTVALESLTFTAVSTTLNAVVLGKQPTFGSVLRDLAWSAGLFSVLRVARTATVRGLRQADLEILSGPVNLVTPFPVLQGYGMLRFRVEQGRWPTRDELSRMTAENVLMLAALSVGLTVVQRWMSTRPDAALTRFRDNYGLEFETLRAGRQQVEAQLRDLEAKGAPEAEIESAKQRLSRLETEFQGVVRRVQQDRLVTADQLRAELENLRSAAPETSAEVLSQTLNLPPSVSLRRVASRNHTYAWGQTGAVERGLRDAGATVTKTQDAATGLRTVEARFGADAPIILQERRGGEVSVQADAAEVQLLFTELAVTRPEAQRVLLRMMTDNLTREPTRDLSWAVREARRSVRQAQGLPGAPANAEAVLLRIHTAGLLRSAAAPAMVARSDALEAAGILRSSEWLDARSLAQFEGIVTEWTARSLLKVPPGGRVLRQIRFVGDAFLDAAGTTPYVRRSGQTLADTDLAELDYAVVVEAGPKLDVQSVANVKAGRQQAAAAQSQNANALAIIRASGTGLAQITIDGNPVFVRVTSVEAKDGSVTVDVTGRLRELATGATEQTIGPRGGQGYTDTVALQRTEIRALAELLVERQLVRAGVY